MSHVMRNESDSVSASAKRNLHWPTRVTAGCFDWAALTCLNTTPWAALTCLNTTSWAVLTCLNRAPWVVQDGCNFEDFINSTCAPSSPTKVINHSDPAAAVAPSQPPVLHHGQGQVRPAGSLLGADVVLPQRKRRRTASSRQLSALHVPAAMGNSSGAVDSARPQALSNPIDHIFQFHKATPFYFCSISTCRAILKERHKSTLAAALQFCQSCMPLGQPPNTYSQHTSGLAKWHDCSCTCPFWYFEPS